MKTKHIYVFEMKVYFQFLDFFYFCVFFKLWIKPDIFNNGSVSYSISL
jgi:hypothetical protein